VVWKPSRSDRAGHSGLRTGGRGQRLRAGGSLLLVLGLLFLAGACGRNVQTNQPYTPGEGINVDIGDSADPSKVVHVRNLMIISWGPGEGVVSGTLVTDDRDSLTGLSGNAIKVGGIEGAPFTGTVPSTVSLANGQPVVLTDQPKIVVKSADIMPGFGARLTLQFENAGEKTVIVPIVDGNESQYLTIKPSATPSV
jgi:hypothetical protein